ncbi:MAG: hypothetical protein IT462_07740 [Planctomycetes bacterium]|nr:hypothetical protein [Planctomycetota bacterium]
MLTLGETKFQRGANIGCGVVALVLVGLFFLTLFTHNQNRNGDDKIAKLEAGATSFVAHDKMECGVTDDGLERLAREHPELEDLDIIQSQFITDKGLKHIGRLKNLRHLSMQGMVAITNAGIAELTDLPVLKELLIQSDNIDDGAVPYLRRFKTLRRLDVSGTKISKEGMAELHGDSSIKR